MGHASPTISTLHTELFAEASKLGSNQAATALGAMLREPVTLRTPRIVVNGDTGMDAIAELPDDMWAAYASIFGDISGRAALCLRPRDALRLAERLMGRPVDGNQIDQDPLARSALKEAANILAGAYVTALGHLLGLIPMLTPPGLERVRRTRILGLLTSGQEGAGDAPQTLHAVCAQTELKSASVSNPPVVAYILVSPDSHSLGRMLVHATRDHTPLSTGTPR